MSDIEDLHSGKANRNKRIPGEVDLYVEEVRDLQSKLLNYLSESKNTTSFSELGDEYLDRVIEILEVTKDLIPIPERKNTEYSMEVLKRYTSMKDKSAGDVLLGVDELLERFISVAGEKLSIESIKLSFPIYPPKDTERGELDKDTREVNERDSTKTPKLQVFLGLLNEKGFSFDNLIVLEEDEKVLIKGRKIRKYPYRIIYLREGDIEKTILISDELGQATFVYEGIIQEQNFADFSKMDEIEGVIPKKIIYGIKYKEKLDQAIFTRGDKSDDDTLYIPFRDDIESTRDIISCRNILLSHRDELVKTVGLDEIDGVWYFLRLRAQGWPEINGTSLQRFPNITFNRENNIGNDRGEIRNLDHLKKLFLHLGLPIATEEQKKERWKKILLNHREALLEAGFDEIDGVWYFGDAKGSKYWPKIESVSLSFFPSVPFIMNLFKDKKGNALNIAELKILFEELGITVASEEQEKERWKKIFLNHRSELLESGLDEINGVWYFGDMSINACPEIEGRTIISFPNGPFNNKHGIGNSQGMIQNPEELKKLFKVFGLVIATPEQEKKRWGDILLENKDFLEESIGLEWRDGVWYFGRVCHASSWPKVNDVALRNYPNKVFLKDEGIHKRGLMNNSEELEALFKVLGLSLASNDQESDRQSSISLEQESEWKSFVLDNKNEFAKVGVYEVDGVWYFGDALGISNWPTINGVHIQSFPNPKFNITHGIGDKHGNILGIAALKKLFEVLGLAIASEEQELELKKRILESQKGEIKEILLNYKKELGEIGIIEVDGYWSFENARGSDRWPKINGIPLRNFPSSEFNKTFCIGHKNGQLSSKQDLKDLFIHLGIPVERRNM